jgi:hypothetical protein
MLQIPAASLRHFRLTHQLGTLAAQRLGIMHKLPRSFQPGMLEEKCSLCITNFRLILVRRRDSSARFESKIGDCAENSCWPSRSLSHYDGPVHYLGTVHKRRQCALRHLRLRFRICGDHLLIIRGRWAYASDAPAATLRLDLGDYARCYCFRRRLSRWPGHRIKFASPAFRIYSGTDRILIGRSRRCCSFPLPSQRCSDTQCRLTNR